MCLHRTQEPALSESSAFPAALNRIELPGVAKTLHNPLRPPPCVSPSVTFSFGPATPLCWPLSLWEHPLPRLTQHASLGWIRRAASAPPVPQCSVIYNLSPRPSPTATELESPCGQEPLGPLSPLTLHATWNVYVQEGISVH